MPAWHAGPVWMDRGEQRLRRVQALVRRQLTPASPGTGEWRPASSEQRCKGARLGGPWRDASAAAAVLPDSSGCQQHLPRGAKQLLGLLHRAAGRCAGLTTPRAVLTSRATNWATRWPTISGVISSERSPIRSLLPLHSPKRTNRPCWSTRAPVLLRQSRAGPRPQARRMRCWISCSLGEEAVPLVAGLQARPRVGHPDGQRPWCR